jgi:hypothetical protein
VSVFFHINALPLRLQILGFKPAKTFKNI